MKNTYFFFFLFIIPILACNKLIDENKSDFQPQSFNYPEMKAPLFFESLVKNHFKDFAHIDSSDFEDMFSENNIIEDDSMNVNKFYTFKILHQLFTSKNASNGSKGEILNVPYFWHWTNPNPRYEIDYVKTNQKLNAVSPSKEFSKYKSFADVDRTPFLFLSDLLSEKPNYFTPSCGKFYTFGWCSEREMAYVCLLSTLGFEGNVITNGNHSWSEFIVSLKSKNNENINFKVTVDNTFDKIDWKSITKDEIVLWKKQTGVGLGKWYNQKAHSDTEKKKTSDLIVSAEAAKNIEESVIKYLKK